METYMQMLGRLAKSASRGGGKAWNEGKEQRASRSGE